MVLILLYTEYQLSCTRFNSRVPAIHLLHANITGLLKIRCIITDNAQNRSGRPMAENELRTSARYILNLILPMVLYLTMKGNDIKPFR